MDKLDELHFIFEEKLKEGKLGEDEIKRLFKNFYYPIADRFLKHEGYKYGLSLRHTKKQLSGIDGKVDLSFEYDTKLNSYYPDNRKKILLEIFSPGINSSVNKIGWLLYSKADVIFWLWHSHPQKVYLLDAGYYLFLKNIRYWFLEYPEYYKKYPFKGCRKTSLSMESALTWDTYNLIIPIQDFPENCILPIKKTAFITPMEESYFYKFFKNETEKDKEV